MSRPRVVCHMVASIDGRIVVDGWPASVAAAVRREYEQVHASYAVDDGMVPRQFLLGQVERRADDVLWMRYRVVAGWRRRGPRASGFSNLAPPSAPAPPAAQPL